MLKKDNKEAETRRLSERFGGLFKKRWNVWLEL